MFLSAGPSGRRAIHEWGSRWISAPTRRCDPRFIAALSLGPVPAADTREQFVRSRARQTATLKDIEIRTVRAVEIDGLSGYELDAVAKHNKTGATTILYQVILFDQNGYAMMQGTVQQDKTAEFPSVFRAMARSFRRTGARAGDQAAARRTESAWMGCRISNPWF